jgi:hypothetical protein
MSGLDLFSALTDHFEPQVRQRLICSNIQSTQDAPTFLARIQTDETQGSMTEDETVKVDGASTDAAKGACEQIQRDS